MAYVSVPKDLTHVKSKMLFGLTKRQIVCFGAVLLMGLPLFFVLRGLRPHQRRRPGDDLRHAPRSAVRAVREARPAVGGGDRADRPQPLHHAQGTALSDQ